MAHGDTRREQRFAAAALAMQGLLANGWAPIPNDRGGPARDSVHQRAVREADLLMAELDSTEANKDKTS